MEGNTQLMRVIREMRSEINKLERENRALRVELKFSGQRAANWEEGARGERGHGEARSLTDSGEERVTSPVGLRRNVSASSALALQEQKGNSMIVRRYSISSSVQSFSGHKHHKAEKRQPSNRILEVQGIVKPPAGSSVMQLTNEEEKGSAKIPADCFSSNNSSKRRSFQEHVYKCSALAGCLQRLTKTVFQVTGLLFRKEMEAMTQPVRSLYTMLKPFGNKYTTTKYIFLQDPHTSITTFK
ncbi:hypothetical protein KIL84_023022 [Mauremys mutica]|uniref:Coiled-coil domain-containing protein 195 n=1 Tax=Mauremys mutica TaxID=74926 RepID=A0A9D4AP99_9SAUR|nr:hypothetical protein KIL84_023022 [Mauremys mutica]